MPISDLSLLFSALGGLAGLAALVTAIASARQAAKKTELDALRQTIDELQEENKRLRAIVHELQIENEQLRKKLGMTAFRQPVRGLGTRNDVD